MPFRTFLILLGLFAGCVGIVLLAWASGSELYVFLPSRRFTSIDQPPTHPIAVLMLLAGCLALFFYSQRYALIFFTGLFGGLLLSSIFGYAMFAWTPTVPQILLTLAMFAETAYGWTIQGDCLDD